MASNVLDVSGGSDSDQAYSSAPEDIPSNVLPPDYDGLPQVLELDCTVVASRFTVSSCTVY